jgi:polar amino acid transport system substrate-binding protein
MKRHGAVIFLSLVLALLPAAARSAEPRPGAVLHLCYEDQLEWSWIRPAKGADSGYILLELVRAQLGRSIDYVGLPWKRCLEQVQDGSMDGAVGASFLADRQAIGVYPTDAEGKPDPNRRLTFNGYHLFVPRDSTLSWDGQHFANLTGPIATILGYSIAEQLKASGAEVYQTSAGNDQTLSLFRLVLGGHAAAAAMIDAGGDTVLQNHPEIASQLVKYPVPLVQKPYYLMFSHQFYDANRPAAEQIWAGLAQLRDSTEYKIAIGEPAAP